MPTPSRGHGTRPDTERCAEGLTSAGSSRPLARLSGASGRIENLPREINRDPQRDQPQSDVRLPRIASIDLEEKPAVKQDVDDGRDRIAQRAIRARQMGPRASEDHYGNHRQRVED